MTITQLQYILAVAEHRNFTLAAQKCFVTQPTLSMQVQKLEDELGIPIFDRSKKPIVVTDIGEKIVDQARKVVAEADRIGDIVDRDKGYIGGDYVLGIIPTVMPTLLPMFLKTFVRRYPNVNLIIREQPTAELVRQLGDSQLDAGIAATPLGMEEIVERPLYYEPFIGYIPGNHALSVQKSLKPTDLNQADVLVLKDGHCFRDNVLNMCKPSSIDNTSGNFTLESGSFETLMQLSEEGLGLTLLPYLHSLQLSEARKALLKPFEKPEPAREISLIYHRNELKFHITEALRETIASIIKGVIQFQDVQIISPLKREHPI